MRLQVIQTKLRPSSEITDVNVGGTERGGAIFKMVFYNIHKSTMPVKHSIKSVFLII